MPTSGDTLFRSEPRSRSTSSMPALNAAVATPVAAPCSSRATNSHSTETALRNTSNDANSTTSAPMTTSRRPRWSDRLPNTSRAPSSAKA